MWSSDLAQRKQKFLEVLFTLGSLLAGLIKGAAAWGPLPVFVEPLQFLNALGFETECKDKLTFQDFLGGRAMRLSVNELIF